MSRTGKNESNVCIYFVSKERLELSGKEAQEFLQQYGLSHSGLPISIKVAEGFDDGEPYETWWLINRENIERVFATTYPSQSKKPK